MPRNPNVHELLAHDHINRAQYWIQEARAALESDARCESLSDDLFELQIELARVAAASTYRPAPISEPRADSIT
jgi:hypothetical protein